MRPLLLRSSLLEGIGLPHGFSTAAAGDGRSEAVRAAVARAGGWEGPLATARQLHGTQAHWPLPGEPPAEADALLAGPGLGVAIGTADCVPVLLADPGARLVAAVHAGWRGTIAGVVQAALAEILRAGATPDGLVAAVGPHIGRCCYEVDESLAARFRERFGAGVCEGQRLDLGRCNELLLREAGLTRIERVGGCSRCAVEATGEPRFFSYRREGERAGRLLSFVGLPAAAESELGPRGSGPGEGAARRPGRSVS